MIVKRLYLVNKDIFFDSHALRQAVDTLKRFSIHVDQAAALTTYQRAVKPKIGSVQFCTPR